LNEELRTLQSIVRCRLIGCAPSFDVPQQEVSQASSGSCWVSSVGGVVPGECEIARLEVSPRGCVALAHKYFPAEVEDVATVDHGEDIRRIIEVLDINGVRTRLYRRAAETVSVDGYRRQNVGLCVLQTKLARRVEAFALRDEPIPLLGIGHAKFVYLGRADCPRLGGLYVVTVYIPGLAINRAGEWPTFAKPWVVLLTDGETHAVSLGNVIIDATKKPEVRIGIGQSRGKVITSGPRGAYVRRGIEAENLCRNRVKAVGGNRIHAGKTSRIFRGEGSPSTTFRLTASRIIERRESGEIERARMSGSLA